MASGQHMAATMSAATSASTAKTPTADRCPAVEVSIEHSRGEQETQDQNVACERVDHRAQDTEPEEEPHLGCAHAIAHVVGGVQRLCAGHG